jgi:hypothetical protein
VHPTTEDKIDDVMDSSYEELGRVFNAKVARETIF